jgi:hypothetical protein
MIEKNSKYLQGKHTSPHAPGCFSARMGPPRPAGASLGAVRPGSFCLERGPGSVRAPGCFATGTMASRRPRCQFKGSCVPFSSSRLTLGLFAPFLRILSGLFSQMRPDPLLNQVRPSPRKHTSPHAPGCFSSGMGPPARWCKWGASLGPVSQVVCFKRRLRSRPCSLVVNAELPPKTGAMLFPFGDRATTFKAWFCISPSSKRAHFMCMLSHSRRLEQAMT